MFNKLKFISLGISLNMEPSNQETGGAMRSSLQKIGRFLKTADGPTAVEYAVIFAIIFLVCISAVSMLGQSAKSSFKHSSDQIQSSFSPGQ
jgi:pilus assembly protein Flp/PilA